MKKNNNKGFSLVELIVVVLILGILAVAISPQVMKWVGESKKSTDINNADALKSSVQNALAEWQATNNLGTSDMSFTVGASGVKTTAANFSGWTNVASLNSLIDEVTAKDYPLSKHDNGGFVITIKGTTGKVTVSCGARPVSP